MKRVGALTIVVALTVAACSGSNDTVMEPDVEVEAVDDVVRQAGDDVQVINGCRIEPDTQCEGVDLSGTDLSRADLRRANLRDANLVLANLEEANLREANLEGVNLSRANLSGADLLGADLELAKQRDTRFCNTTMSDGSVRNWNC